MLTVLVLQARPVMREARVNSETVEAARRRFMGQRRRAAPRAAAQNRRIIGTGPAALRGTPGRPGARMLYFAALLNPEK